MNAQSESSRISMPQNTSAGRKWRLNSGALLAAALVTGSVAVTAATPAISTAVAARKANYKEIGGAFKTINDEIKSGAPDMNMVKSLSRDIASRSALQLKHFPKGSGPESGLKTRAKPEIWKDFATFSKLQRDMVTAATAINAAATARDAGKVTAARNALGATCKGCHDKFRSEG